MSENVERLARFLHWGFGDLRSNTVRGVLAEFLVAELVGADLTGVREEWAPWDVVTPDGVRVEVKATAYVQAWANGAVRPRLVFGGLLSRSWTEGSGYVGDAGVRADVYVFGVNTCRELHNYDPLNLDQWEWRVVPAPVVASWRVKSVSLVTLERLGYGAVPPAGVADAIRVAAGRS